MHGLGAEDKPTEFSNCIKKFEIRVCPVFGSWLKLNYEMLNLSVQLQVKQRVGTGGQGGQPPLHFLRRGGIAPPLFVHEIS